jgi:hypothetical protein
MMGARRSLRSLLDRYKKQKDNSPSTRPPTCKFNTIGRWSQNYDWVARVNRWQELEQERTQREWRDRHDEIREQGWGAGQSLIDRAEKMLAFPLSTQKVTKEEMSPDGTQIIQHITIEATDWTNNTISTMLKTAIDLCRMATGLETERVKMDATVTQLTADDLAVASANAEDWEKEQFGNDQNE